ncbi:MAG: AbrB/MazE/SpoVT family DNA-binding domain-containing protein [Spiribacter salinus]|uniref:AbrB/MazE/SpoVT family DNA-binding domain-containing protein n=1 Tax=Spiribacter salinus TaxID=1335746 RepID=A0A540VP87_9GAMM|nr:MAG: AbrB/MazE/SpoVT family DNA-binding domain-containing protein [Spiribacter salinus]
MHTTLTGKGQVTLPKALRERLRLSPGDRIEFVIQDDGSVRLLVKQGSLHRLRGALPGPERPVSLEEMDEAIRKGSADQGEP